MKKIITKNNLLYILIFLIFFTSSFDIFLTIEAFGFTFRISQLLCTILFIIAIIKIIKNKKIICPIGWKPLLIWTVILLLFTFNTVYPKVNFGYHAWLIFDILIIFSLLQLVTNKEQLNLIIKLYIYSFVAMAIVGIMQFILGIIGVKGLHITQWWISEKLPRINGFSFEPSYYATYMLMGWIICRVISRNNQVCKKIKINILFALIVVTIAMIMSSSRIGILFMMVFEGILFVIDIYQKTTKSIKIKIIIVSILIFSIIILSSFLNLKIFLGGIGIGGTSPHSVSERKENFMNVIEVFKESPILGRGLGGIYAEIGVNKGLDVYNVNVQDEATAISVFAEVLAASGIFGFAFFIKYIIDIITKSIKIIKNIEKTEKYIMLAFILSFIMEMLILQFNQNILRMYVWLNIGMISTIMQQYCNNDEKN